MGGASHKITLNINAFLRNIIRNSGKFFETVLRGILLCRKPPVRSVAAAEHQAVAS